MAPFCGTISTYQLPSRLKRWVTVRVAVSSSAFTVTVDERSLVSVLAVTLTAKLPSAGVTVIHFASGSAVQAEPSVLTVTT